MTVDDILEAMLTSLEQMAADDPHCMVDRTSKTLFVEGEYDISDLTGHLRSRLHPPPSVPDDIRAKDWVVAVHNDYRLYGKRYTFWLFTHEAVGADQMNNAVRGEGRSDGDALNEVRRKIGIPER